jgi:hypothetical protein
VEKICLLKLFQEWGKREIKENGGGGEFKYDIFDTLYELLQMPQCTPAQHNKKKVQIIKKEFILTFPVTHVC